MKTKTYNLELTNKEMKFIIEGLVSFIIELNSKQTDYKPESKKVQYISSLVDKINTLIEGKPYY